MVDRQKELDKLLDKLRESKDEGGYSDIDLVLEYLEKYIAEPKVGGGSNKILQFDIQVDNATMGRKYQLVWQSADIDRLKL